MFQTIVVCLCHFAEQSGVRDERPKRLYQQHHNPVSTLPANLAYQPHLEALRSRQVDFV